MRTLWQGGFLVQPQTSEICFAILKPHIELQYHFLHLHLFIWHGKRETVWAYYYVKVPYTVHYFHIFISIPSSLFPYCFPTFFLYQSSFRSLPICSSSLLASQFSHSRWFGFIPKWLLFQFNSSSSSIFCSFSYSPSHHSQERAHCPQLFVWHNTRKGCELVINEHTQKPKWHHTVYLST